MILTLVTLVTAAAASALASPSDDPAWPQARFKLVTGIPGQAVRLASEVNGWSAVETPLQETSPGTYELSMPEPWLPTLSYKFVVDGRWQADPRNPLTEDDGHGGYNSVRPAKSFREDPLLSPGPATPAMRTHHLELSDLDGVLRSVTVVVPASWNPRSTEGEKGALGPARPAAVYFHDGGDYLERTSAPTLLANLSRENGMPRLAGVFIPPRDRMKEYGLTAETERYTRFLAEKVIPEVEARFQIGGASRSRLLVGPSLGGLVTFAIGMARPELFGQIASQSGSLWYADGKALEQLQTAPIQNLRIWSDVGLYEGDGMVPQNREAEAILSARGIEHVYHEYPSTHDWIGWRNRLGAILRWAFQTRGRAQ